MLQSTAGPRGPTSEGDHDNFITLPPDACKARAIWEVNVHFQRALLEIQKTWGGSAVGKEENAIFSLPLAPFSFSKTLGCPVGGDVVSARL